MPLWDSSAPRKKLPPPTTMATSTSGTAAAICLATAADGVRVNAQLAAAEDLAGELQEDAAPVLLWLG